MKWIQMYMHPANEIQAQPALMLLANSWIEDKHVVLGILHQKKKFQDESEKNMKNTKLPGYIQRFFRVLFNYSCERKLE